MNYSSLVFISGAVAAIDQEKRDITLISKTPKGKDVSVIVHMWKSPANSDNPAHAARLDWQEDIQIGQNIAIAGHMGNNGRVIATRLAKPDESALMSGSGETLYA